MRTIMSKELHLFIIWNRALSMQQKIIADLVTHCEIRKIFKCHWEKETFTIKLAQFYKKKLHHSCKKEKECGDGDFLVIVLYDNHPQHKNKININIKKLKQKYRQWTSGKYLIHASDTSAEAEENLKYLTHMDHKTFLKHYPSAWDGKSIDKIVEKPIKLSHWQKLRLHTLHILRIFL